ncbi:site-specific integrase [Tessaracoccus rhinocerotis]|uniref:Site-specific integrase n=1 Tax=Tessaracoccus rhinocerotis TaxID=1689449 RepID=A0A553JXM5_9ACTN|nr:site-specific integrase [Tessaracoccus rhinocerotis]TRY17219.1 site-specific integrase [Tessaracoccus rhinocerotis]
MAIRKPFDYKGRPGSENTRAEILRVLKTALELATQRQRIARNPAETVRFKPVEEVEITPMEREEVAAFFKAASLRPDVARWLVGFTLGLRQGEVLGLKWSDFNLETGVVKIRRQWVRRTYLHGCKQESKCPNKAAKCPDRILQDRVQLLKTKASKRTVMLAASVLPVLKKHRAAQAQRRLRASYWDDGDWVFTNNVGQPIEHRRDLSDIKKICRDAGIPERRVHDMRHQLATAFMLGGVSERELMSWFGWTSTRMAGRYQHVVDEAKRNAAEAPQV